MLNMSGRILEVENVYERDLICLELVCKNFGEFEHSRERASKKFEKALKGLGKS